MDLARAPRRAARKKGSGYENALHGPIYLSKHFRQLKSKKKKYLVKHVVESLEYFVLCFDMPYVLLKPAEHKVKITFKHV